jgi:hypothetical protein
MTRRALGLLGVVAGLAVGLAQVEAQTIYVPHAGRVVAVPVAPAAPTIPSMATGEGGMLRVDGLPAGAVLAIDGRVLGPVDPGAGAWVALPPGPHFVDVALPGGAGAIRFTVVTPAESEGYRVVPRP